MLLENGNSPELSTKLVLRALQHAKRRCPGRRSMIVAIRVQKCNTNPIMWIRHLLYVTEVAVQVLPCILYWSKDQDSAGSNCRV